MSRGNSYLEHLEVAEELRAGGEVVSRHGDVAARLAPHVAQAVVAEVCHAGPGRDVHPAVGARPVVRTQTHTCRVGALLHLATRQHNQTKLQTH